MILTEFCYLKSRVEPSYRDSEMLWSSSGEKERYGILIPRAGDLVCDLRARPREIQMGSNDGRLGKNLAWCSSLKALLQDNSISFSGWESVIRGNGLAKRIGEVGSAVTGHLQKKPVVTNHAMDMDLLLWSSKRETLKNVLERIFDRRRLSCRMVIIRLTSTNQMGRSGMGSLF